MNDAPLQDDARLHYKVCGALFALTFAQSGAGPIPLSPFVFYAILSRVRNGRILQPDFFFSHQFIRQLDPAAAEWLQPWLALTAQDDIRTDPPQSLKNLLFHCETQVCPCHAVFNNLFDYCPGHVRADRSGGTRRRKPRTLDVYFHGSDTFWF